VDGDAYQSDQLSLMASKRRIRENPTFYPLFTASGKDG
jgi:hypothetical protein